jgi:hypothetical protein
MPLDIQRLEAAAHYVIAKTDPGQLGYIKLNTILWYSDLKHYRWYGVSITWLEQYTRTPQGPMSNDIVRAVGRLTREAKVEERLVGMNGYTRREIISVKDPDNSALTEDQIGILNQIVDAIAPLTASQLYRITHEDPLWKELKNNEAMLVATGSVMLRPSASNGARNRPTLASTSDEVSSLTSRARAAGIGGSPDTPALSRRGRR